ncbi:MAG: hypothetical protein KJ926_04415, partial [Candidatus Omnitrophica bacterium]|nr:hypothetical protein [Candidatus Omnitrophota bacterium]
KPASATGVVEGKTEVAQDTPVEVKSKTENAVKERPPVIKKPAKKFFSGIKNIFKKERDSL